MTQAFCFFVFSTFALTVCHKAGIPELYFIAGALVTFSTFIIDDAIKGSE